MSEFKSLDEEISYWAGRICLGIGKGDIRSILADLLMSTRHDAFEQAKFQMKPSKGRKR